MGEKYSVSFKYIFLQCIQGTGLEQNLKGQV